MCERERETEIYILKSSERERERERVREREREKKERDVIILCICFPFQTSLGIMEMLGYNKEGTEQAVAALQREKDFLRNNAMVLALLIFLGHGF